MSGTSDGNTQSCLSGTSSGIFTHMSGVSQGDPGMVVRVFPWPQSGQTPYIIVLGSLAREQIKGSLIWRTLRVLTASSCHWHHARSAKLPKFRRWEGENASCEKGAHRMGGTRREARVRGSRGGASMQSKLIN